MAENKQIRITGIEIGASFNFQSIKIQAEFPEGITKEERYESIGKMQETAIKLAVKQSEMVEAKKQANKPAPRNYNNNNNSNQPWKNKYGNGGTV